MYNEHKKIIPDNLIDILYYGDVVINDKQYYYLITPFYETNLWPYELDIKKKFFKSLVNLLKKCKKKIYLSMI